MAYSSKNFFVILKIKLIFFLIENALGLCHVLSNPCAKPQPQMWDLGPELRDKWEINRSEIQLIRKLGRGNFGMIYQITYNALLFYYFYIFVMFR